MAQLDLIVECDASLLAKALTGLSEAEKAAVAQSGARIEELFTFREASGKGCISLIIEPSKRLLSILEGVGHAA